MGDWGTKNTQHGQPVYSEAAASVRPEVFNTRKMLQSKVTEGFMKGIVLQYH